METLEELQDSMKTEIRELRRLLKEAIQEIQKLSAVSTMMGGALHRIAYDGSIIENADNKDNWPHIVAETALKNAETAYQETGGEK